MNSRSFFRLGTVLKQPYHWFRGLAANLLYGFPSRKLRVIGVTGTDGKTTTSTLIYHLLKSSGKKVALISTVSAYIGNEAIDTGFHVTTPDEFALQKLLRRIRKAGMEFVVLEATSHGIYQHRLFGIKPKIAVLTNVTREHLDYHNGYEEYLKTKISFLRRARFAVINKDDKSFSQAKELLKKAWNTKVFPYGAGSLDGRIRSAVMTAFPQTYNRENATAALTVMELLNIPLDSCVPFLKTFPGVPGRMEEVKNTRGIRVIVDFAHTPNALERALKAIRSTMKPGQKLIAVFGCAGLRDPGKRPMMGRIASELADEAVFTAEDPRTEDVNVIIRQMKEGVVKNHGHMHEIADRRRAIFFAIQKLAKKGDVVGIFGKGHETSLNMDGRHELPWSDVQEAKKALQERV